MSPCCSAPTVPGLVFDPFCGSGTTLAVALAEARRALGFELNPEYVQMAEQRARKAEREYQPPLFAGPPHEGRYRHEEGPAS